MQETFFDRIPGRRDHARSPSPPRPGRPAVHPSPIHSPCTMNDFFQWPSRLRTPVLAAGLVASVALAGYGLLVTKAHAAAAGAAAPRPAPLQAIRLQLNPMTAVAQETGILKEEYDKVGIGQIVLVAPGSAQLSGAEAALLNNGGVAIAQRMIYPAVVHAARGLDAVIIWESQPSDGYRTPILARADNQAVNTLADLDGKKFGSSRVSCYWTSPFETLTKAGLPLDSRVKQGRVRYQSIDQGNAAVAALLSGAIDATAMHLGTSSGAALYTQGQIKVVGRTPTQGVYERGAGRVSYFAMRDFADRYPQAVQAFLIAQERTKQWVRSHPDEAAKIVAKATRVPEKVARFQITDASQFFFMEGERDANNTRATIKEFQDWYVANGDDILSDHRLPDERIHALVDERFFGDGPYSPYRAR